MANLKSQALWATVMLALGLVFAAAVAYLVWFAPGTLGYRTIFETLGTLARLGAGATLVSLIVVLVGWKSGNARGRTIALLATLLFAAPVGTLAVNQAAPPPGGVINDVTTDLDDPPVFNAVIPLRGPDANPIEYGGAEVAAVQRAVHPDVQPILTPLSPDDAFQRAFETGEAMGWEIVAGDHDGGIIEAVDTTTFFRFKDDIVVRIRATPTGSRVDLRSRSRVGRSDLGKNAARILEFADNFMRGT